MGMSMSPRSLGVPRDATLNSPWTDFFSSLTVSHPDSHASITNMHWSNQNTLKYNYDILRTVLLDLDTYKSNVYVYWKVEINGNTRLIDVTPFSGFRAIENNMNLTNGESVHSKFDNIINGLDIHQYMDSLASTLTAKNTRYDLDLNAIRPVVEQFFQTPYNAISVQQEGGSSRQSSSKWQRTKRTVTTKDGVKRVLYMNASKPGDLRIRKMGLQRSGKRVARYVKP
jgi:hypothetical protein